MSVAQPLTRPQLRVVLLDGAGAERGPLLAALLRQGYAVTCVDAPPPARDGERRLVLGDFRGAPPEPDCADIAGLSVADVTELVDERREVAKIPEPGGWKPWFPVIDYDRCTDCMQCLSFCLFDVYGVDDAGHIQVQNQSNCKTDCPACSRVCPDVAILFPKYHHGPINGDVVSEADLQREAMKVDISSLLGGDIYKMLRERSAKAKSRFSRERDDERALKERKRCLAKLKDQLGIPDELLSALPSLSEIQHKAEAAKARAQAARGEGGA